MSESPRRGQLRQAPIWTSPKGGSPCRAASVAVNPRARAAIAATGSALQPFKIPPPSRPPGQAGRKCAVHALRTPHWWHKAGLSGKFFASSSGRRRSVSARGWRPFRPGPPRRPATGGAAAHRRAPATAGAGTANPKIRLELSDAAVALGVAAGRGGANDRFAGGVGAAGGLGFARGETGAGGLTASTAARRRRSATGSASGRKLAGCSGGQLFGIIGQAVHVRRLRRARRHARPESAATGAGCSSSPASSASKARAPAQTSAGDLHSSGAAGNFDDENDGSCGAPSIWRRQARALKGRIAAKPRPVFPGPLMGGRPVHAVFRLRASICAMAKIRRWL